MHFFSVTDGSLPNALNAPTDLQISFANGVGATLTWKINSTIEDGFSIERSTTGVYWDEIGTVSSGVSTYVDGTAEEEIGYYYAVRATKGTRKSAAANRALNLFPEIYTLEQVIIKDINGETWFAGQDSASAGIAGNNSIGAKSSFVLAAGNHSFSNNMREERWEGNSDYVLMGKSDGSCWGWGANTNGQLGNNSNTDKSSPVAVVGNHSFVKIMMGLNFSIALKADGSCWGWGSNNGGYLGDNSITNKSSPVAVVGNHSFVKIIECRDHTFGLKSDGSCWGWGNNNDGKLGDNSTTDKSSPVAVVGNHSFVKIAAHSSCAFGLKSDGSCWGWGDNSGKLGDNSTTDKSSPVAVAGNHSFIKISNNGGHAFGLKADGSCWGWGGNSRGELGDNSNTDKSSPVAVVGNHSFVKIIAGSGHTFGLKSDGSCWGWGANTNGQLGNNSNTDKSSPVAVVGNHSFIKIAVGIYSTYGLKSDGTCWVWGYNQGGRLGDGSTTNRSSPVLINRVFNNSIVSLRSEFDFKAELTEGGVLFSWQDFCNKEEGYAIQKLQDGSWSQLSASYGLLSYTDPFANTSYRIKAYAGPEVKYSYSLSPTENPPSSLAATLNGNQIDLSWTDNSSGTYAYVIERKDSGTYSVQYTTSSGATSWSDTTIITGNTYIYRIRCTNDVKYYYYIYSSSVDVSMYAPTNISLDYQAEDDMAITWNNSSVGSATCEGNYSINDESYDRPLYDTYFQESLVLPKTGPAHASTPYQALASPGDTIYFRVRTVGGTNSDWAYANFEYTWTP